MIVVYISLIITAIHIVFAEGNILSPVRVFIANNLDRLIGLKWSKIVQKPVFTCLPCMASIWTILIAWRFDVWLILAVCGLNVIISRVIEQDEVMREDMKGTERVTEYYDEIPTLSRQVLKKIPE